jgi:hypothetical protein
MYRLAMLLLALSSLLALSFPIVGAVSERVDIVTMKNGDIHHGTVAQEYFKILSPYGSISVPYGGMRLLTIGSGRDRLDRIGTSGFETFSGKLHAQSLFMLRVLDAPLELDVQDIGEIEFAQPVSRRQPVHLPDAGACGTAKRPVQWAGFPPTRSVCTTRRATPGSGWPIVSEILSPTPLRKGRLAMIRSAVNG